MLYGTLNGSGEKHKEDDACRHGCHGVYQMAVDAERVVALGAYLFLCGLASGRTEGFRQIAALGKHWHVECVQSVKRGSGYAGLAGREGDGLVCVLLNHHTDASEVQTAVLRQFHVYALYKLRTPFLGLCRSDGVGLSQRIHQRVVAVVQVGIEMYGTVGRKKEFFFCAPCTGHIVGDKPS